MKKKKQKSVFFVENLNFNRYKKKKKDMTYKKKVCIVGKILIGKIEFKTTRI